VGIINVIILLTLRSHVTLHTVRFIISVTVEQTTLYNSTFIVMRSTITETWWDSKCNRSFQRGV